MRKDNQRIAAFCFYYSDNSIFAIWLNPKQKIFVLFSIAFRMF